MRRWSLLVAGCWLWQIAACASGQDFATELFDVRQRLEALERENQELRREVLERLPPVDAEGEAF
ncbi:MAG TPA: hypothetical protein VFV87_10095, partial [Pirellulaceae bacterium]|nr:hypothetical protein [Pirellulaceae bacterium]